MNIIPNVLCMECRGYVTQDQEGYYTCIKCGLTWKEAWQLEKERMI